MNILLTSAGRRGYLVEYFKEALQLAGCGGLVHAANSGPCPAFASADRSIVTPLIYDKDYIPFLAGYCKMEAIDLVIPLFDIDIPVLAAHRELFASMGITAVTADPEAAGICNDKWRTYTALSEAGIPVPAAWLDMDEALLAVREGKVSLPLMVKPRWGMGSLSVFQADSPEEVKVFADKCRRGIQDSYLKYESEADKKACVLFQQRIGGQEYGLDVMNDLEGRYRRTAVKQKVAMRSGETDSAETVFNKELENLGERLGALLRHRGNLDVDVLEENGRYYVLEMNARFGGGYPFSHAAGVNLPLALVQWALGNEPDAGILTARPGVRAWKDIRICLVPPGTNTPSI